MRKLLFITDLFPDEVNPVAGIFVKQQVDELSKRYKVKVIATTSYHPAQYQASVHPEANYEVLYVNSPVNKVSFFLSVFDYFRDVIPGIRQTIKDWKPDMIHVHDCRHVPELFCLRNELDRNRIKTYLTLHNIKSHPRLIKNPYSRILYKVTMFKSFSNWTHVFTVNPKIKQDLLSYLDEEKITVIGNGIPAFLPAESNLKNDLKSKMRPGSYKILSVGNLVQEKGFDFLIEAVKMLNLDNHDIQLVILGGGPMKDHLKQLILDNHLESDIALIPRQPNEIVRNLYPLFDAFVLPSYSESFGIVYLEAMYACIPVIGVQGQGIDGAIVDGINGLLMKPKDVDDLIGKITYLKQSPEKAKEIAIAGEKTVKENYMLPKIIDKIEQIYEMKEIE